MQSAGFADPCLATGSFALVLGDSNQASRCCPVPLQAEEKEVKWETLVHSGVLFPPDYTPHGVKMLYDGKPIDLTPEQEEVDPLAMCSVITNQSFHPICNAMNVGCSAVTVALSSAETPPASQSLALVASCCFYLSAMRSAHSCFRCCIHPCGLDAAEVVSSIIWESLAFM